MACLWKIEGVTRRDRIRNEEIFNRLNIRPGIIDRIRNKHLCYFIHVNRMKNERYPKITYNGYVHGTRKRGRQKKRWINMIRELQRTASDTSGGHMLDIGQESVESNHRRAADVCNGIAWAVMEIISMLINTIVCLFCTFLSR